MAPIDLRPAPPDLLGALLAERQARPAPARHVPVVPREPVEGLTVPAFETKAMPALLRWFERLRYRMMLRRALLNQPDGVLADCGITRSQLAAYVARPFWRA